MFSHKVIKDTREKKQGNGWFFDNMEIKTMKTGDYTLAGYEDSFVIERKCSTGEVAKNIVEERFVRELERMENFKWPFIILEFDMVDLTHFPENSGIPKDMWPKLRINAGFILKKICEYQIKYKTKILFASKYGKQFAEQIFREILRFNETK